MEYRDDYELSISRALPGAIVKYVPNFNDVSEGWEITPDTGILIKLLISMDNPVMIQILMYQMNIYNASLKYKNVYYGAIPHCENFEPDYKFIETILKNYKCFLIGE